MCENKRGLGDLKELEAWVAERLGELGGLRGAWH